VANITNIDGLI